MPKRILYLYGFSPRIHNHLQRLARIVAHQTEQGHDVAIALLHDGVVGAVPSDRLPAALKELLKLGAKFYVLGEDLDARGLGEFQLRDELERIDYDSLIDLIVQCDTLCSWM